MASNVSIRFSMDSIFWCCCRVNVAGSASRGLRGEDEDMMLREPRGVVLGDGRRGDMNAVLSDMRGDVPRGDAARRGGELGGFWFRGVICGDWPAMLRLLGVFPPPSPPPARRGEGRGPPSPSGPRLSAPLATFLPGELLAIVPPERELNGPAGWGLGKRRSPLRSLLLPSRSLPLQSRPPLAGPSLPALTGSRPLLAPPLFRPNPPDTSPTPVRERRGTDGGPPAGATSPWLADANVKGGNSGHILFAQLSRPSHTADEAV